MNHTTTVLILVLLATMCCGCMSSDNGYAREVYVHENTPHEKLITIEQTQTYAVYKAGANTFGGNYMIVDGELFLFTNTKSLKLCRNKNAWVDGDGDRWIKE